MPANAPGTAASTIRRLRRMLGHANARDRDTILEAIEGLIDLSVQLWRLKNPAALTPTRAALVEITRVDDANIPRAVITGQPDADDLECLAAPAAGEDLSRGRSDT